MVFGAAISAVGTVDLILLTLSLAFGGLKLALGYANADGGTAVSFALARPLRAVSEEETERGTCDTCGGPLDGGLERDETADGDDTVRLDGHEMQMTVAPLVADIVRATGLGYGDLWAAASDVEPEVTTFMVTNSSAAAALVELFSEAMPYARGKLVDGGDGDETDEHWGMSAHPVSEECDDCHGEHLVVLTGVQMPTAVLPELTARVHRLLYPEGITDIVDA